MKKRLFSMLLVTVMAVSLAAGCAKNDAESKETGEQKTQEDSKEEGEETNDEAYKIGIVTPTLTVSEDEFRGAEEMVKKYPDLVVHKTLPEDFATNKEGCISVVTSLADDPEMKYILFDNGMEGIVPAFQTIREKRPDIVSIVTCNDDPKLLNEYVDIAITTDWVRRGVTIPTKAHEMGAKTFIHYSFPTRGRRFRSSRERLH